MELLHHQPMLREEDGQYVCSRCELLNPTNGILCIPVDTCPSAQPVNEDES
jgi:hypothetical protein